MIKILVIGEICTDTFVYCEINRICPEAPVPILQPIETIRNSGMSGNVVSNLKSINSEVNITHWFQKEIVTKTRFVEKKSNHMFIRLDEGEEKITPLRLGEEYISDISIYDIVIISDYNKGFISDELLVKIGKNAKLSILDSKRILTKEIVESFTFIKLNEKESKQNKKLSKQNNVIVTLGGKGSVYQNILYPILKPKETIDVSGAGDTFTSSFILKYYETKDVSKSIEFANDMASIVVSKRGVATP
jgi:bifunctional ADP-heptose synthase (sugar kinase/adenylyltransferase)